MYTEVHKCFLQYMLHNGVAEHNFAEKFVTDVAEKLKVNKMKLSSIIADINVKIAAQLFRIDTQICEISCSKMYVFVNTTNDEISKLASVSPAEVDLFSSILASIMTSNSKSVSTIRCLNLSSRLAHSMTKDFAQTKINFWSKAGYLAKSEGHIYLGPRTIAEFEVYLRNQYPDRITICQLCTVAVYHGKICAECFEVLHMHCVSKYLERNKKCPICKKKWQEATERSYGDKDDSQTDS